MRVELRRLHRELQATMIYVTHDQVEAMTLGDRVAVMNAGKILQVGSPLEVYQRPANLFVARFVGNVPMNLLTGTATKSNGRVQFRGGGFSLDWELANPTNFEQPGFGRHLEQWFGEDTQRQVVVGFRAENLVVCDADSSQPADAIADVYAVDQLGDSTLVYLQLAEAGDRAPVNPSADRVGRGEDSLMMRLSAVGEVEPGDRLKLKVERKKILWFDPESGQNLLKVET